MNTRRTCPTSTDLNPSEVDVTGCAPVANPSDGSTAPRGATLGDAGEGESGASGPIHPFQGHRSDGSDYYSSAVYVNSDATSSSREPSPIAPARDPSEHIPALGFDCDCDGCLRVRQAAREEAAQLANPDHYARAGEIVRHYADGLGKVVPIRPVDRPAVRVFEGDRELSWAEVVARSRGQLPTTPRPKHLGLVMFWLGCGTAAALLWVVVSLGGGQ